ncbi:MAG TPA: hypothetical protein V6D20_01135, partial [Candidatus Obscuribacterales bacterium]
PYMDRMAIADLEKTLEPLFAQFKQQRQIGESFGDFCHRVGFEALRQFSATYQPKSSRSPNRSRYRIGVGDEIYAQLKTAAEQQGRPMTEVATEAIAAYLKTVSDS